MTTNSAVTFCARLRVLLGGVGLLAVSVLAAAPAGEERTSENDDRLKRILKARPQADANKDGILTMSEARAYREKTRARPGGRGRPAPDLKDHHYGAHRLQVLDLWKAKSETPTPLVVFIHGGGFRGGDKRGIRGDVLNRCLAAGISYASINYRLTPEVSFPQTHLDAARAIQTLRHNAKAWNLDPKRFASTGGSAGAGISMWLAFKDDLADAKSDDPVARQSTRLTCIAVSGGQCSYDPYFAKSIGLPGLDRHPFFLPFYGIKEDEKDTPKARKLYEQAAAITYVSKDDPPALLDYGVRNDPVTDKTPMGAIVHHPKFGLALKERLDKLGVECIVQYPGHPAGKRISQFDFIRRHFGLADEKKQ